MCVLILTLLIGYRAGQTAGGLSSLQLGLIIVAVFIFAFLVFYLGRNGSHFSLPIFRLFVRYLW